jgi:NAD(P)-dependent dehydrogenase (short-subunit alcohol dehydrogenase family)
MSHQKVALVTGCSEPESLGAAMASSLLSRGWKVYATSINVDSMANLREAGCDVDLPGHVLLFQHV